MATTSLVLAALLGFVASVDAQVVPSGPPPDGGPATSELRAGSNSFTQEQARDRLERSGYSEVTGLTKDESGIWRGKARYGEALVTVGLDYRGAILRTQP
ncbi:PepSY domain-containing protein [Bosea sp. OAE506]|uniref:PepSY domain-containing protein n=1 Tax=Bosea sp. OAE506 TaxID=2663870 RepID=UPI0033999741